MFHRLLKAYKQEGFEIHIGNNHCLCAALTKNGNFAHTGGGISLTDVSFFFGLQKIHNAKSILCIGNAAGYGTLCIAEIFDDSEIDVMDAEVEGAFNTVGSELTKKFSEKYYDGRIHFIKGFCPTDLNQMEKSWEHIKHNTLGFKGYNVDFTNFGCKALVRGLPIVEEWLSLIDHSPMREFANPVATLKASIISQPSQAEQTSVLKDARDSDVEGTGVA
jgi:hypothetical protein